MKRRINFWKIAHRYLCMYLLADAHANGYLWARSLKLPPMMLRDSLHNYGTPFDLGFYEYIADLEHDAADERA